MSESLGTAPSNPDPNTGSVAARDGGAAPSDDHEWARFVHSSTQRRFYPDTPEQLERLNYWAELRRLLDLKEELDQ